MRERGREGEIEERREGGKEGRKGVREEGRKLGGRVRGSGGWGGRDFVGRD